MATYLLFLANKVWLYSLGRSLGRALFTRYQSDTSWISLTIVYNGFLTINFNMADQRWEYRGTYICQLLAIEKKIVNYEWDWQWNICIHNSCTPFGWFSGNERISKVNCFEVLWWGRGGSPVTFMKMDTERAKPCTLKTCGKLIIKLLNIHLDPV